MTRSIIGNYVSRLYYEYVRKFYKNLMKMEKWIFSHISVHMNMDVMKQATLCLAHQMNNAY